MDLYKDCLYDVPSVKTGCAPGVTSSKQEQKRKTLKFFFSDRRRSWALIIWPWTMIFGIYSRCTPLLLGTQVSDIGPSWSSCLILFIELSYAIKKIWHSLTVVIKVYKTCPKKIFLRSPKACLITFFKDIFNKILSQQLTHDRFCIALLLLHK